MAEREYIRPQGKRHEEETVDNSAQPTQHDAVFDVDNILDDIDGLLEENATSFVQGFVQKGGE